MIATLINAAAVVAGAAIGLLFRRSINESAHGERYRTAVYGGIGVITLVIGFRLSFESRQIVFLALAVASGGLLGEWWRIEDGITRLGGVLHRLVERGRGGRGGRGVHRDDASAGESASDNDSARQGFAAAFLNASVLFCVGAMTLVGSFRAGAEGDYELLLTKSVLDGFMSVLLAAAMGIGVAFASLVILVYQGGLTLLAGTLQPLVTPALLAELSAVGGVLIVMIGINLLGLRRLRTANFLPAFPVMVGLVALQPLLPG